jgi:hypothetical protein
MSIRMFHRDTVSRQPVMVVQGDVALLKEGGDDEAQRMADYSVIQQELVWAGPHARVSSRGNSRWCSGEGFRGWEREHF